MINTSELESFELPKEETSLDASVQRSNLANLTDNADLYSSKNIENLITSENTREYWKDRMQENLNLLNLESPDLLNVYRDIVTEQPHLRVVKLTDEDIEENAYFCWCALKDGQLIPEIAFNFKNQETYISPDLEFTLRSVAIQLGAKYEDVKNNKKLVTTFVILHEFGHAKDFIDNYLNPKENIGKKNIVEALTEAGKEKGRSLLRDLMTLPVPEHINLSKAEYRKKYRKRLETFGIKPDEYGDISHEKVDIVQSNAYREMSSESIADSFAKDYIMKHRHEYFLPLGERDDYSGRIMTGGEIMMENKDIILSGIRDGNNITLKKIGQDGHSEIPIGYSRTGFLDGQLSLGESIRLVQDIDDQNYTQTSPIKSISRRLLSDGRTLFIAKTHSGALYEIIRNPTVKPELIQKTVEEMSKALGIKEGSEVIIMKRHIVNEGNSTILIGATMQGRLETSPELYRNISLRNEEGNFVGKTSPIEGVRRIWRSWVFKTYSNSFYEIVPTE